MFTSQEAEIPRVPIHLGVRQGAVEPEVVQGHVLRKLLVGRTTARRMEAVCHASYEKSPKNVLSFEKSLEKNIA